MGLIIWSLLALASALFLAYHARPLPLWLAAAAVFLAGFQLPLGFSIVPWVVLGAVGVLLTHRGIRRRLVSAPLLRWFRSVLPPLSDTERVAIDAGTVWWDGELFTGRPDWQRLLDTPAPAISEAERAFLDGPTEELCRMLDDWRISQDDDLPPQVWDFMKRHRFFGMIIPRQYGGLEFSARAQSEVVMKIATRSTAAAVTVMVPNSLGPGELLLHYGTPEQKDHYLPRLARGEEVPAFALTGPYAGSDAGSMPDRGVVCEGEYQGRRVLGFRVTWSKRYITLGPVATVLGLAFKAEDPDGLLGDRKHLGITCALIPTNTAGVVIGERHRPGAAFQNGPNSGTDVFVPMEWLIGGREWIGQGWRMLMECLSVGRSISLPAMGVGAAKVAARTTGAYARVRKQFRMPIGRFEGVEEALARIAGNAYRMDAARVMTAGAVDAGQKPAVLSAVLKHFNTEGMRKVVNDAMDVHAGRGVCTGPRNYLAGYYSTVPIAITVEGANLLTRSMIVFGQGAIRCHPFVLKEILAAADPDHERGLAEFDETLFAHVGFTVSNAVRAWAMGLTGARFVDAPQTRHTRRYYRQLTRMSAAFAFVADVLMLVLGGELKRREKLSGRLADVLSHLYVASAVLKQHRDHDEPAADLPIVEWALTDSLYTIQQQLHGVLSNLPVPLVGSLLKLIVLPLGCSLQPPGDRLGHEAASLLLNPSVVRDRLTAGMYLDNDPADPVGRVELAMEKAILSEPLERRLAEETGRRVTPHDYEEAVAAGLAKGVITDIEAQTIREAQQAVADAIAVDHFATRADLAGAMPAEAAG